jgi:hypothetical protein
MSNDKTGMDLNSVDGIKAAIESCKDSVMKGVLEQLLATKNREIALLAKQATSKKIVGNTEMILKSIFVAVRQHVDLRAKNDEATKAFNAAVTALNATLAISLQEAMFTSSIWHCAKSNVHKAKDITAAVLSYRNAAKQAKALLRDISDAKWDAWSTSMDNAAQAAATKRGITWEVPAYPKTVEAEAAADTVSVPAAADTVSVPAAADKKKVVITTRRGNTRGKNK